MSHYFCSDSSGAVYIDKDADGNLNIDSFETDENQTGLFKAWINEQ